jgi:hypothetical protein
VLIKQSGGGSACAKMQTARCTCMTLLRLAPQQLACDQHGLARDRVWRILRRSRSRHVCLLLNSQIRRRSVQIKRRKGELIKQPP